MENRLANDLNKSTRGFTLTFFETAYIRLLSCPFLSPYYKFERTWGGRDGTAPTIC